MVHRKGIMNCLTVSCGSICGMNSGAFGVRIRFAALKTLLGTCTVIDFRTRLRGILSRFGERHSVMVK
jgi:hypothetical protein